MIQLGKHTTSKIKMAKKRYMNTRDQSFFGNYIYDQIAPLDHFLRLLDQDINWERFTRQLNDIYRGDDEDGRSPFNPAQLPKICLLAKFYDLTERQAEAFVNENLSSRYFVCSGIDQRAPARSCQLIKISCAAHQARQPRAL